MFIELVPVIDRADWLPETGSTMIVADIPAAVESEPLPDNESPPEKK
jgi:hypothetical protein